MKKSVAVIVALVMVAALVSCKQNLQQGDTPMQYFFSGEIISAEEDYLLIEVNDTGNSNLPDGCTVEVATKTTGSGKCPDFSVGEYAKVLMAQSVKDDPPGRLEAVSIYKVDETGGTIAGANLHDLSEDGELQVSAIVAGNDPFMVGDTITTNSEKISITNHCSGQINAYLYADTDLETAIRELVIESGKTESFTGLTSRLLYRVALSIDDSGTIDATIEE